MKQEINPKMAASIIGVIILLAIIFGYTVLRKPSYTPPKGAVNSGGLQSSATAPGGATQ